MKYQYENIVRLPGDAFSAEYEVGPVLDCVYHVHREFELTLVESSSGSRFIGSSLEPFGEGDLVLVGAMLPHHYLNLRRDSTGPDWSRLLVVKFTPDFCGADLLSREEATAVAKLLRDAAGGVHFDRKTAAEATPLMHELPRLHGLAKSVKLLELLDLLSRRGARILNPDAVGDGAVRRAEPDERLNRVLSYIHRRIGVNDPPTLTEAARIACMTPQAFSSYFRRSTRRGFVRYIAALRLDRAARLLAATPRTVRDIAAEVGYENLSNFNRRFRALRGMSPSEYRAEYRIDS